MGVITLMGSGETSPTMVKVHRRLLERTRPARAVLLDTPFGFQENADVVTERIVDYFAVSLNQILEVATFRSAAAAGPAGSARVEASIEEAGYVFSGPGSPSYALRQWADTGLRAALLAVMARGGAVTLASAAAVTGGTYAVPVYEIYKVGEEPHWLDGLDVLGPLLGLPTAVIPHFDNAEGGNHDTRFCYLGRRRLDVMRSLLDDEAIIFGIDEHTAVSIEDGVARVEGRGAFTMLVGSETHRIEAGQQADLGAFMALSTGSTARMEPATASRLSFDDAIAARDPQAAADAALLALDSGEIKSVAAMILRLADAAAAGLGDRRTRVTPLVELLLDTRQGAREAGRWDESDRIRDGLAEAGIEVRDTGDGTEWALPDQD